MTILSDRWKGLRMIPHVSLARLPTPVEPLPALSRRVGAELYIKRDDGTSPRYGGNKVRKLEYALGEALAKKADTIVTAGAAGSHHAVATALFGAELGLEVHATLVPQRFTPHAEEQLRALLAAGAIVHPTRGAASVLPTMTAIAARARLRGRRAMVLAPGGSSVAGVIGHVEAGLELARQMEAGVLPEPDAVFVPLGTGGTLAGLCVGLAAAGITARVIGVRVVHRSVANRTLIGRLVHRVVAHLRALDERFPDVAGDALTNVEIDHAELGAGYGVPTSAGRNAERLMRAHGVVELDPTYTAKAFAAVLRRARGDLAGRRLLYVHTLNGTCLDAVVRDAPVMPAPIRRLLKRRSV